MDEEKQQERLDRLNESTMKYVEAQAKRGGLSLSKPHDRLLVMIGIQAGSAATFKLCLEDLEEQEHRKSDG